jgi:CubicO group peptidase (beta-lactamase class C family)
MQNEPVKVHGTVAKGFEGVAAAIASCGPGVTVAAILAGETVIDVWTDDLAEESLVCTWSSVKPITGACLLRLVERGRIGLDDTVVSVWPEIGDERMLVRHVLTHTAGRITVPIAPLTDWTASTAALAAQPADWAPGEVLCEHALTFGHLVGEIVRRVDGRSLGTFFREQLAVPLGLDISIGVAEADLPRVADTVGLDRGWWAAACGPVGEPRQRSLGQWFDVNDAAWRRAEVPAVNGHATARGLAGFWQAFLDDALPAGLGESGATGVDRFVGSEVTWSLAGGRVDGNDVGMGGLGGQWGAARRVDRLAWAFLTNHVGDHDRADAVERALLAAVAGRSAR